MVWFPVSTVSNPISPIPTRTGIRSSTLFGSNLNSRRSVVKMFRAGQPNCGRTATAMIRRRGLAAVATRTKGQPIQSNVRRRIAKLPSQVKHSSSSTATTTAAAPELSEIGGVKLPYGLRRVDYSKGPGPQWPLPISPPDNRNPLLKALPLLLMGTLIFTCGFVYVNWDESVLDYWRAVERGDAPIPGLSEDEDDDDELLDDEDEWEEVSPTSDTPSTKDTTRQRKG
ncbi:hypothetical protein ACA910_020550 [Epithemia clementina (nom. ined.)]